MGRFIKVFPPNEQPSPCFLRQAISRKCMSHLGPRTTGSFLTSQRTCIPNSLLKLLLMSAKQNPCCLPENRTRHPVQSLQLFSTRVLKQDMALNKCTTHSTHSTNPRWSYSKKNPCSMQCLCYIFKNNLHVFTFLGNRNAKSWVVRLPQSSHSFPPRQDGLLPDPGQAPKPLCPFKFGAESRGAILTHI